MVDYRDPSSLSYALQGIDLVISTVSGPEQLSLIHAAGQGRVRYFVPAEFEGSLDHRPSGHDALRPDSPDALELLHRWSQVSRMRSTVFSCGVFMERFHPYGLASLNIGLGSGVSSAGTYLVDVSGAAAEYADRGASGSSSHICLTSVYDLVRFVIAAIDVGPKHWPKEFTLRGDRLSVRDVVDTCSYVRNSESNSAANNAVHEVDRRQVPLHAKSARTRIYKHTSTTTCNCQTSRGCRIISGCWRPPTDDTTSDGRLSTR